MRWIAPITSETVFRLPGQTEAIVKALAVRRAGRESNNGFFQIIREGTRQSAVVLPARESAKATRPILDAHFHARFFMETAVRYSRQLTHPPALQASKA